VGLTERLGLEGVMPAAEAAPLRVGVYAAVALGAWLELPAVAEAGSLAVAARLALVALCVRVAAGAGEKVDGPAAFVMAIAAWMLGGLPDTGAPLLLVVLASLAGWDSHRSTPSRAPV
jgi:hypothetical protein